MKYNRRAMKNRTLAKAVSEPNKKIERNWKKIFLVWLAVDAINILLLAGYLISKKKQKPMDKMAKDINKKYRKTKKRFTKKADKLLKELECSAGDLMNSASEQMNAAANKAENVKLSTLGKTKETFNDLQVTLEELLRKLKK